MSAFIEQLLSKLDQDLARIILVLICCASVYLSLLVLIYVLFMLFVLIQNNKAAKKRGITLIHKFRYSWFKGVILSPIVVEKAVTMTSPDLTGG